MEAVNGLVQLESGNLLNCQGIANSAFVPKCICWSYVKRGGITMLVYKKRGDTVSIVTSLNGVLIEKLGGIFDEKSRQVSQSNICTARNGRY